MKQMFSKEEIKKIVDDNSKDYEYEISFEVNVIGHDDILATTTMFTNRDLSKDDIIKYLIGKPIQGIGDSIDWLFIISAVSEGENNAYIIALEDEAFACYSCQNLQYVVWVKRDGVDYMTFTIELQ